MKFWRSLAAAVGVCAIMTVAYGGMVRTRSGQTYQGQVHIEGDALVVDSGATKASLAFSDIAEANLRPDPPPVAASAPSEPTGLTCEFFTTFELGRPVARQIDPTLDFDWGGSGPEPAIGTPSFTARWTGALVVPRTGRYILYWHANPGSRLWLDGKKLVDQWTQDSWRGAELHLDLQKGPHDLRVDFIQSWNVPGGRLEWSAEGLPRQTVPSSALRPTLTHPPVLSAGTGLLGEYFADRQFKKRHTVRRDNVIDFDWLNGSPEACMTGRDLSIRWTGQLEPAFSETYTLSLRAPDQTRLWLNGAEIKTERKPGIPPRTELRADVPFKAGQKVDLRIECVPANGMQPVSLSWFSPSQPREIIPRDRLYPPPSYGHETRAVELAGLKDLQDLAEATDIPLTAKLTGGQGSPSSLVFLNRGEEIARCPGDKRSVTWKNASPGWHLLSVQAIEADGSFAQSPPLPIHIVQANLPGPPWRWSSVCSAWHGREARLRDGALDVRTGDGRIGLESSEDSFEFIHQELHGDGEIVAHIQSLEPEASTTTAGVMVRDGLGRQQRFVFAGYTAGNFFVAQRGNDAVLPATPGPSTGWVKLLRRGPRILVWTSQDGRDYKLAATLRMELPPTVCLGVAVLGANREVNWRQVPVGHVKIDSVQITPAPPLGDSPPGVRFADGSLLAGTPISWDAKDVTLQRPDGQRLTFPATSVASFEVAPLDADWAQSLETQDTGVMTRGGDFLAGAVRPAQPEALVVVDSIVLGLRRFTDRDLAAVVLRKAAKPTGLALYLADGSVLQVKSLRATKGRLSITLPGGTVIDVAKSEVQSARRR